MRARIWIGAVVVLCANASAQSHWQMQGARMRASVVVAGKDDKRVTTVVHPCKQVAVTGGDVAVHFPRNQNGKPRSLKFAAPDGALVNVAVHEATQAPVTARLVDVFGDKAFDGALVTKAREMPFHVHTSGTGDAELRDYRATVVVTRTEGLHVFGIVARHHEERGCYLFSIDWAAKKVRLERWMGKDHLVVRQMDAPWLGERHTLALQVHGFRMQCTIDDEVVLHSFDGALTSGAPGLAWVGARPELGTFSVAPVAEPLASAALVQEKRRATLHTAVSLAPGHFAVMQLSLDRPHPWVPRTLAGVEPFLSQPPVAPSILLGDWRNSLGSNSISEVGFDGTATAELVWPDLLALRGQAALARLLLVTPDGTRIAASTPAVTVIF